MAITEGQGAREVEEAMAHLLVCLGARGGDRRGLVGGSRERLRGLIGDEVVLVGEWPWGWVDQLHRAEVKWTKVFVVVGVRL